MTQAEKWAQRFKFFYDGMIRNSYYFEIVNHEDQEMVKIIFKDGSQMVVPYPDKNPKILKQRADLFKRTAS